MTRPAPLPMMPTCTVELDVVEVVLLGLELERVGGVAGPRTRRGRAGGSRRCASRVTLPSSARIWSSGVRTSGLTSTSVASSPTKTSHSFCDGHRRGVEHLGGQVALLGDRAGERQVDTLDGVDGHLGQPLGLGRGDLFDLHAALDRAHRQVGAVGAVEQEGDVVLLGDVAGLGDQQLLDDVALDVQAEDVLRVGERVVGGGGVLHATGLAAAAGLDLRLHHDRLADLLGDRLGVLGGCR